MRLGGPVEPNDAERAPLVALGELPLWPHSAGDRCVTTREASEWPAFVLLIGERRDLLRSPARALFDLPYAAFDDGLSEPEERRAYAAAHKKMYEIYLRWSSLKANLQYNGFADDTTLSQLDCHYRFLSAFVHPISDTTRVLYGNNAHGSWPRYDHYSSELALLYTSSWLSRSYATSAG